MSLNFELKKDTMTGIQKVHVLFMYIIAYITLLIFLFNVLHWASDLLGLTSFDMSQSAYKTASLTDGFGLVMAVVILVLGYFNLRFAKLFKRRNPYKLNITFLEALVVNLIALPILLYYFMVNLFNSISIALVLINFLMLVVIFEIVNLFHISKKEQIIEVEEEEKKTIPKGFFSCPTCNTTVKIGFETCPVCHRHFKDN